MPELRFGIIAFSFGYATNYDGCKIFEWATELGQNMLQNSYGDVIITTAREHIDWFLRKIYRFLVRKKNC